MHVGEGLAPLRALGRVAWMLSALLLFTGALLAQPSGGERGADGASPGALSSVPAARRAKNIAVITIRGDIDRVMATSVRRRIAAAEAGGADAIVFEIDTFGGELGAALEICNAIESCKKPTTAWVNAKGISAGAIIALACNEIVAAPAVIFGDAAPVQISASGLKSMRDTERAKVLTPILTQLTDSARRNGYDEYFVQGLVKLDVELWLVERADTGERRFITRDEYRFLFNDDPAPARPALAGVGTVGTTPRAWKPSAPRASPAPGAAASPTDMQPVGRLNRSTVDTVNAGLTVARTRRDLSQADVGKWTLLEYVSDGTGIFTLKAADMRAYGLSVAEASTDEELKAFFAGENLIRVEPAWYESLAKALDGMIVKGVLIILFLLGLFVEMMHPGLVLPGAVAFLSLVMILAPDILLGAGGWWEVIAILIGVGCILLEIFILPGFGVFGVAGLVLLFGGLLGTFMPGPGFFPDTPEGQSGLVHGVATLLISTVVAIVLMYFLGKHFGNLPLLNRLVLKAPTAEETSPSLLEAMGAPDDGPVKPGAEGVAITPLRPSGRVQVGDEIIDVVAEIGFIAAGQPVRVTRVQAFCINVEPLPPDSRMDDHRGEGGRA